MIILPDLPYTEDALEPVISAATLQTHHGKHHARYVAATNALLGEGSGAPPLEEVVADAARRGEIKLFNNAAQALNHGFYWASMAPPGARKAQAAGPALRAALGDVQALRDRFLAEGAAHFGSGWVWLTSEGGVVSVATTHDGDGLLHRPAHTPLLVCDVWEHAYYLDHRNDRAAYLAAWWDRLADWSFADRQYAASLGRADPWRYPVADAPAAAAAAG
jgi:Fe-Mn family superoxide dismutase